jgi:hypothetical protein
VVHVVGGAVGAPPTARLPVTRSVAAKGALGVAALFKIGSPRLTQPHRSSARAATREPAGSASTTPSAALKSASGFSVPFAYGSPAAALQCRSLFPASLC